MHQSLCNDHSAGAALVRMVRYSGSHPPSTPDLPDDTNQKADNELLCRDSPQGSQRTLHPKILGSHAGRSVLLAEHQWRLLHLWLVPVVLPPASADYLDPRAGPQTDWHWSHRTDTGQQSATIEKQPQLHCVSDRSKHEVFRNDSLCVYGSLEGASINSDDGLCKATLLRALVCRLRLAGMVQCCALCQSEDLPARGFGDASVAGAWTWQPPQLGQFSDAR